MKYTLSSRLKYFSIGLIVIGIILFALGYVQNSNIANDKDKIDAVIETNNIITNSAYAADASHTEHFKHGQDQLHNRPWSAMFVAIMLFFGIGATSLFFYAVQHAGNAGWSIIITRVMEGIASYLPIGGALLFIFILLSTFGLNHIYHWMDPNLTNTESTHFDLLIKAKEPFLNKIGFVIRSAIYIGGVIFFMFKLKSLSKRLDETKSYKDHSNLYKWSVIYIVFFALASAAWAWDWLMSIDPHWYSTLYMWYSMVSCLVSAVAFMMIICAYLSKKGALPSFNDNHMHDLSTFLFGFSLLWSYLWFCQFMLYWYANVPEEVAYFFGRYHLYRETYFVMLIPNLILPFLILISTKIKRNYTIASIVACIVIFGHFMDYFNIIVPGTVGAYWNLGVIATFGLYIGAFLLILGVFLFSVMYAISKLELEPKGNPFFKESKDFEYPF